LSNRNTGQSGAVSFRTDPPLSAQNTPLKSGGKGTQADNSFDNSFDQSDTSDSESDSDSDSDRDYGASIVNKSVTAIPAGKKASVEDMVMDFEEFDADDDGFN
jgi:hypothetical protein